MENMALTLLKSQLKNCSKIVFLFKVKRCFEILKLTQITNVVTWTAINCDFIQRQPRHIQARFIFNHFRRQATAHYNLHIPVK